jgi:hypothetical protein
MNDAVAGLVWLLVNGLLAVAVWRTGGRCFPDDVARQRVIHALIIGWAIVAGAGIALGSVGGLTPAALLASVAAVAAGLLVWCRLAEARDRRGAHRESGSPSVGCARILVGCDSVPTGSGRRPNLLCVWWTAAWRVLAALLAARLVLDGLTAFPRDWDSLAYHLPLMDHWLRDRTLYMPDCAFWYVPANNGLIGLWCVAPFSGDFLFALNNVPTIVLLVLLARRRWTDAVKAAGWGVVSATLWGGYWYARNVWVTGAPLFPKGFGDSADVWSELRPDSHTSTLLQSGRVEVWPMLAEAV